MQAVSSGSLTATLPHSRIKGERAKASAAIKARAAPQRGSTVSPRASINASMAKPEGSVDAQLPKGSQLAGNNAVNPPISQ